MTRLAGSTSARRWTRYRCRPCPHGRRSSSSTTMRGCWPGCGPSSPRFARWPAKRSGARRVRATPVPPTPTVTGWLSSMTTRSPNRAGWLACSPTATTRRCSASGEGCCRCGTGAVLAGFPTNSHGWWARPTVACRPRVGRCGTCGRRTCSSPGPCSTPSGDSGPVSARPGPARLPRTPSCACAHGRHSPPGSGATSRMRSWDTGCRPSGQVSGSSCGAVIRRGAARPPCCDCCPARRACRRRCGTRARCPRRWPAKRWPGREGMRPGSGAPPPSWPA
jgi:hypothetical protein